MNVGPLVHRERVALREGSLLLHRNTRPEPYPEGFGPSLRDLHAYPDLSILQKRIAVMHNCDPEEILLTSGVDGAIKTVFETCVETGDDVAYLSPTYMMYDIYARAFGASALRVFPNGQRYSVGSIETAIKRASIVFIPSPSAPIVEARAIDEMARLADLAKHCGTMLVFDEAYHGFGADTAFPLAFQFDNVLVARSFSKAFGLPHIRVGYLIGNRTLVARMASKRHAYEISGPSAQVALWALDNLGVFKAYMNEVAEAREFTRGKIEAMGLKAHGEKSNSLLVEFHDPVECTIIVALLSNRGVVVRYPIPHAASCFGVTIGTTATMKKFLSALKESRSVHATSRPTPRP